VYTPRDTWAAETGVLSAAAQNSSVIIAYDW